MTGSKKIAIALLALILSIFCMSSLVGCDGFLEGLEEFIGSLPPDSEESKPNGSDSGADPEGSLQVHVLNVGQGDAIAIKFDSGKTMLIDTGTSDYQKKHHVPAMVFIYMRKNKIINLS